MLQRKILTCLFLISFCRAVSSQSSQCDCDITKSWNDIMLLVDRSELMGSTYQGAINNIISAMYTMSFGNGKYQSQVGAITYTDKAEPRADLGSIKQIDDLLNLDWGHAEGPDTNIVAGIDAAMNQLASEVHRTNSRKLIILGVAGFRSGDYENPIKQADIFKDNGGQILVLVFGDLHGDSKATVEALASPGMLLGGSSATNIVINDIITKICEANCFCPLSKQYFPAIVSGESWPSLGCYALSTMTTTNQLFNSVCQSLDPSGVQATPDTTQKQQALLSGAPTNTTKPSYYIGLHKTSGQWMWNNGEPYAGNDPMGEGDCALLQQGSGFSTMINATDCGSRHFCACQTQPCTTNFYC